MASSICSECRCPTASLRRTRRSAFSSTSRQVSSETRGAETASWSSRRLEEHFSPRVLRVRARELACAYRFAEMDQRTQRSTPWSWSPRDARAESSRSFGARARMLRTETTVVRRTFPAASSSIRPPRSYRLTKVSPTKERRRRRRNPARVRAPHLAPQRTRAARVARPRDPPTLHRGVRTRRPARAQKPPRVPAPARAEVQVHCETKASMFGAVRCRSGDDGLDRNRSCGARRS